MSAHGAVALLAGAAGGLMAHHLVDDPGWDARILQPGRDFRDLDALKSSTAALRRIGFGSRWAIHPAQVLGINEAFMPTPEQLEAARRLVERSDGALDQGVGVCVDEDGHVVDEAVVRAARRTLAQARTAEQSNLR